MVVDFLIAAAISLAISLALQAISYALTPKPKTQAPKAAGLEDFTLPTATEGRPIPVVFGTVLLRGPNVVWAGALRTEPRYSDSGGKK
jgi:predicted phage tail protein